MNLDSQVRLCALLKYFHHGDFSRFRQICDQAIGDISSLGPYNYSNLYTASNIAGMIEVSETGLSNRWWASIGNGIEVNGHFRKTVETTGVKKALASVVITDGDGNDLILGSCTQAKQIPDNHFFGKDFWSRIPRFNTVERQLCIEEPFRFELGKLLEGFDPQDGRWKIVEQEQVDLPLLVRSRGEYSGLAYFVVFPELNLLFRILHPEWAFMVALNLLNWPLERLCAMQGSDLKIKRSFRLPTLLLRFLFASSSSCSVGHEIKFSEVPNDSANSFFKYLDHVRGNYAF